MTIIRVRKDANYFSASNEPFNDRRLSWEARGLMGFLLSKPDLWQVRKENLMSEGPAGDSKLRRMLAELRCAGYMNRIRVTKPDGTFDWITEVYESPSQNPSPSASGAFSTSGKPPDVLRTEGATTETTTPDGVTDVETVEGEIVPPTLPVDWKMAYGLPIVPADLTPNFDEKLGIACSSMPAHLQHYAEFFARMTGLLPDSKRDLSRWRGDLKQWYEKKLEDKWLTDAYDRMKKDKLTVSAPGSLTNVAAALRAEAWKKEVTQSERPAQVLSELQMALTGAFQVAPKPVSP